jgi:plastocyanin
VFNAASKLYFAVAGAAIVLGFGYVIASSDRVGFAALVFAGLGALTLGVAAFALLPPDPLLALAGAEPHPADTTDVARGSAWAPAAAFAATVAVAGLATDRALFTLGLVAGIVIAFGWLGQVWREHPSWTDAMDQRLHDRFIVPIVLPATIFVLAGIAVISLSRLLLAVSEKAAPLIVIVAAAGILALFYVLANRDVGRQALATLAVVAAGLVVAAGVAGAVKGGRHVEAHGHTGELSLAAKDVQFDLKELHLPAAQAVDLQFVNDDDVQHNFALYDEQGGAVLFQGPIVGKGTTIYKFTTPPAGTYFFQCDVHPTQMEGTAVVAPVTNKKPGTGTGGSGSTGESTTSTSVH